VGGSIHFTLHLDRKHADRVGEIAASIAKLARDLGFAEVDDPRHLVGPACNVDDTPEPGLAWVLIQAQRQVDNQVLVPEEIHVVRTVPGAGCEPANIGLSRYVDTPDWTWTGQCKTRHAAEPGVGGVDNYVRCHVALCSLLAKLQDLGVTVDVRDEVGYWTDRDAAALAERVTAERSQQAPFAAAK
jgi:hypothetical protein